MLFRSKMRTSAFLVVLCFIAATAFADVEWQRMTANTENVCVNGYVQNLRYDIELPANAHFLVLDETPGLEDVSCTRQKTEMILNFASADHYDNAVSILKGRDTMYITSKGRFSKCHESMEMGEHFSIGRVIDMKESSSHAVVVSIVRVDYQEVFRNGDVDFRIVGECPQNDLPGDWSKNFCLGLNTKDCQTVEQAFAIYQNALISVSCKDCFMGFQSEAFFHMSYGVHLVDEVYTGLKNMNLNGALVLEAVATKDWGTGVDKNFNLLQNAPSFGFSIGPIGLRMWFGIPVEIILQADFLATATADAGISFNWNLGDMTVDWKKGDSWKVVKPDPSFNSQTVLSGSASFDGKTSFQLIPGVTLTVDNVITMEAFTTPQIDAEVSGSTVTDQICANVTWQFQVETESQLHLDILSDVTTDTWGPKILYDSGVKDLGSTCVGGGSTKKRLH